MLQVKCLVEKSLYLTTMSIVYNIQHSFVNTTFRHQILKKTFMSFGILRLIFYLPLFHCN